MTRDELIDEYTHGECMVMAATLNRITGAPIVGIFDDHWFSDIPRHVGVKIAQDLYADARGAALSEAAFIHGYDRRPTEVRPFGIADLHRIWGYRVPCWDVPQHHLDTLGLTAALTGLALQPA